jgi:hypothetical protein
MIAIIQCAARKWPQAGYLTKKDGTKVKFVADPAKAPACDGCAYARPDDLSDAGPTWRQVLLQYNTDPGNNPLGLFRACELYQDSTYRRLADRFGAEKTYILSAGWGLIRADFLTPYYDITFTHEVKKKAPYKFRRKQDAYSDFCQLPSDTDEPIVFLGGNAYVPLFCKLTRTVKGIRTVFHYSPHAPRAPGCRTQQFPSNDNRRWHYECANAFIEGRVAIEP